MGLSPRLKFVIGGTLTILSWDNPVTAFFRKSRKLRHSLGRPSRSDFVQFPFVGAKNLIGRGEKMVNIRVMTISDYDGVYQLWINTPGMGLKTTPC